MSTDDLSNSAKVPTTLEEIRASVQARYGATAQRVADSATTSSCCGPSDGSSGCCGESSESWDPITADLYDAGEMAGIPEHAADGLDTGEAGAEAADRLTAVFGSRPRADWLTLADALGIPLTPVNDLASARDELAGRMERTSLPGGGVMATPAAFLGVPGLRRPLAPAPTLGADTSRVLHEFGFTAEEIAAVSA